MRNSEYAKEHPGGLCGKIQISRDMYTRHYILQCMKNIEITFYALLRILQIARTIQKTVTPGLVRITCRSLAKAPFSRTINGRSVHKRTPGHMYN